MGLTNKSPLQGAIKKPVRSILFHIPAAALTPLHHCADYSGNHLPELSVLFINEALSMWIGRNDFSAYIRRMWGSCLSSRYWKLTPRQQGFKAPDTRSKLLAVPAKALGSRGGKKHFCSIMSSKWKKAQDRARASIDFPVSESALGWAKERIVNVNMWKVVVLQIWENLNTSTVSISGRRGWAGLEASVCL